MDYDLPFACEKINFDEKGILFVSTRAIGGTFPDEYISFEVSAS